MADIIEEIGDLVGEEDKGDVRTATRTVSVTPGDSGDSTEQTVTVSDLVNVEDVVAVLISSDSSDPTFTSVITGESGSNEVVAAKGSPGEDNNVEVDYLTFDGTNGVEFNDGGTANTSTATYIKVIARGY